MFGQYSCYVLDDNTAILGLLFSTAAYILHAVQCMLVTLHAVCIVEGDKVSDGVIPLE